MAAADPLLDPLRVPGQVVVDDQIAELQVDAFGGGLGGDHDGRFVAEILHEGGPHVGGRRAGDAVGAGVLLQPALIDPFELGSVFVPLKSMTLPANSVCSRTRKQILLRAARLGEDDRLLLKRGRALILLRLGGGRKAATQGRQQHLALGVLDDRLASAWNSRSVAISCRSSASCSGVSSYARAASALICHRPHPTRRRALRVPPSSRQFLRRPSTASAPGGGFELVPSPSRVLGNGIGGRCQQLAQDERHQLALARRQSVERWLLQVLGDQVVEPLLFVVGTNS